MQVGRLSVRKASWRKGEEKKRRREQDKVWANENNGNAYSQCFTTQQRKRLNGKEISLIVCKNEFKTTNSTKTKKNRATLEINNLIIAAISGQCGERWSLEVGFKLCSSLNTWFQLNKYLFQLSSRAIELIVKGILWKSNVMLANRKPLVLVTHPETREKAYMLLRSK